MRKLKMLGTLSLAGIMTLGTLTGCGSSAKSEEAVSQESSSAAESTAGEAPESTGETDYADLKIGLVLSGSANDGGWSQMAADAITEAAEKYGCETNFSESVQPTDFESTIRGYAEAGYNIIVAHGSEFLDSSKAVAAEFPDIQFINTSSLVGQEPNLAGVDLGSYENGFLVGLTCGYASESGKIGVVCAMEGDTTALWNEALEKGAKTAYPDAEVSLVYTGSYDDQLKAKQAAQELINKGCDVITENADIAGVGAIQQCDESKVANISAVSNYDDESDCVIVSVCQDSGVGITTAVEEAIEGELGAGAISIGAAGGVNYFTDYKGTFADRIDDDERAALAEWYQKALDGVDFETM